ncbi:RNAse P Rpr2/Rpp21/SNM1 subunit domain-containing protein [Cunninghamella echinulata]|nr:RNAse P Rpr2/Rpp21/SNM1 subunit domain-containing protein [Cunninghamella echinulata]
MVKQKKGPSLHNLQVYQRMNFLNQAATLMSTLSQPIPSPINKHLQNQRVKKEENDNNKTDIKWQGDLDLHPLSRYYNSTMKKIGRRLVIRVDPQVKRSICKRCDASLIPGLTSSIRVSSRHQSTLNTRCHTCGSERKIISKRDYILFNQRPEIQYNKVENSDDEVDNKEMKATVVLDQNKIVLENQKMDVSL